jgi:putative FmdB family regulatory protein
LIISEVFVPTYSYACTECSNRFDAVQAFSDAALTTCPECSGRLRKLFGNVGVVFKGSGFYRNDSRESAKSTANGSSSSSTSSAPAAAASS